MEVDKHGFVFCGIRRKVLFILVFVLFVVSILFQPYAASAASLTAISDTMSRLKVSTASNHTIKFTTPTGIVNTNTITLTFPSSSFTMGASLTGVTIADGAGADNAVTSAAYSTNVLTITASASSIVAAGHVATIKIPTTQITNPSTAATYIVTIGGTFGDSGKLAIAVVADDQVQMTATVNPSITFYLSANSSAFGELSTGSIISSSDITLTVGTNAQSGYSISVLDTGSGTNPGLYNTNASSLIGSADGALSAGTEGYGIQAASGNATIESRFSQGGDTVGGLGILAAPLASYATGMNANHTVTITHKAAISSWTKAGAYVDTITYLATGNF